MSVDLIINPIRGLGTCDAFVHEIAVMQGLGGAAEGLLLGHARRAIHNKQLVSRNPETGFPADLNEPSPLVTLDDFKRWFIEHGARTASLEPQLQKILKHLEQVRSTVVSRRKTKAAPAWIPEARIRAEEIIADRATKGRFPSQIAVADEIAREFRAKGVFGSGGKPLTGETIKRHALKGIDNSLNKLKATAKSQGK